MRITLLLLSFIVFKAFPSQEHAWIYFADKPEAAQYLSDPHSMLTDRAISRKLKYNIPVDLRDVPVNETYISTVKGQTGIAVMAKSKWFNTVHVEGSMESINALADLSFVSRIEYANKSLNKNAASNVSNKPKKDKLENVTTFNYGNAENQVTQIRTDALHDEGYTGKDIVIAVLDAGFPNVNNMTGFQRLRSEGLLLDGYDFVRRDADIYAYKGSSHGTLVLSTMAGYVEGNFVGTAPDAAYYLFRTEEAEQETPVEESYWVEAAERADSLGVDVINTSLGYSTFDDPKYNYTTSEMNGEKAFISKGANIAVEKGILVVTSAGNEGNSPFWGVITAPADANVLTAGAVNANGEYVSFSSRGPTADGRVKPDVMTQGAASAVINSNDVISTANGTSFSAPILAGSAASLWQAYPDKTNIELMQMIRESASLYSAPTSKMGYGIPDFGKILEQKSPQDPSDDFKIFPNPTYGKFQVIMPKGTVSAKLELYDVLGKKVLEKNIAPTNNTIDVSALNKGVYIAQITSSKTKKTLKIVKQ